MTVTTDEVELMLPISFVQRTANNVKVDHIKPQMIGLSEPAFFLVRCGVFISEREVENMVHDLFPYHETYDTVYSSFTYDQIVSRDTTIKIPFADKEKLSSAERPLSDVLGLSDLELRGTFNINLIIVMENKYGTEVIRSAAVSGITPTNEHMRYMTDETFPYYTLRGYHIPHDELYKFMDTY